jgi:hypothetical protein
MTTFQDPPLQSRRSVRQNERDQSPAAVVPTTGPTPMPVAPPAAGEPLTYATQARPSTPEYDGPSFRARRTPEPVGDVPTQGMLQQSPAEDGTYRPRDYSPEGRRSASPSWAPQYGGAGQPPVTPAEPAAVPADPSSTFAPHAAPVIEPSALDADDPIEHTLTRRELRALRDAHGITSTTTGETVYPTPDAEQPGGQPAPQASAAPAPVQDATPVAAAPVDQAPVAQAPVAQGTPLAAPSTRLDSALAEFDQLAAGRPAAVPTDPPAARGRRAAAKAPEAPEAPEAQAPEAQAPEAQAPPAPARTAGPAQIAPEALGPQVQPVPLVEPPAAQAPAPQPAVSTEIATDGVAVFDALFSAPAEAAQAPQQPEVVVAEIVEQPVAPAVPRTTVEQVVEATIVESEPNPAAAAASEPSTTTPPTGHWSTQAKLDDETQFGDEKLARNIGSTSGAITTSALVLPSIPDHEFGPISTGDGLMLTGSISLPASLSATGAHPKQLDESDLDHLLDPGDHQVANTDSQPVRAIKAVSTHTSSRGVIGTVKPKGTRGLTALIIAATSMAVLVGALFIVLVATGQL